MKIRSVGAQLFYADGQTDRHDEANSHFSQILRTRLKTHLNFLFHLRGPDNYVEQRKLHSMYAANDYVFTPSSLVLNVTTLDRTALISLELTVRIGIECHTYPLSGFTLPLFRACLKLYKTGRAIGK